MVTAAEFNTVFGTTNGQLTKLGEWMDAVHPKDDGSPNTLDDVVALIKDDFAAKYKHWKADQTEVTF